MVSNHQPGEPDSAMEKLERKILGSPKVISVLAQLANSGIQNGSSWNEVAKNFAHKVASTREPNHNDLTDAAAARFTDNSFSIMYLSGLDKVFADGKTAADYLLEGGGIVFRNHQSYAGFVCDKTLYAQRRIPVTFIAGSNIVDLENKEKASAWMERLTRSGVKLVERNPPPGKMGLLYFTELGVSLQIELSGGGNISIYGNGRERFDREASLKTALISFFLEHGRFILPAAESYEVILDDRELAGLTVQSFNSVKGGASFDVLFRLERRPELGENPCGEFYLNFGVPIPTSQYNRDTQSMRNCEAELKMLTTRLMVLPSTYLLAAAVNHSGFSEVSEGQATDLVGNLLLAIDARNAHYIGSGVGTRVFTAPKLRAGNLSDVVRDAAEKLVSRGALASLGKGNYSVGDQIMLGFYAAKGEAHLTAHGIQLA